MYSSHSLLCLYLRSCVCVSTVGVGALVCNANLLEKFYRVQFNCISRYFRLLSTHSLYLSASPSLSAHIKCIGKCGKVSTEQNHVDSRHSKSNFLSMAFANIGTGGVFASCLFVRQFALTKVFMFDGIQERSERSKVFACYFWAETSHV